jgi:aryl-alcohol dehydrogenase-like predicted oxidoreductase
MQNSTLGASGLNVSRAVLGTMTLGSQIVGADAASLVDYALDSGINFIDTANVYNNGESERILGNILKERRDKFILATKVGIRMGDGPDESGLSALAIKTQLENSLSRLQTEYVDLFYLHQPDPQTDIAETLEAIQSLIEEGKIRFFGTSNFAAWQIAHMVCIAQQHAWSTPVVTQPMYNLLARGIEQELLPMCREYATSVIAYNPLAGGLLTGKHRQEAPLEGTRFDTSAAYRDRYWHAANFQAIESLERISRAHNLDLVSLSLRWLWSQDLITGVLIGASRLEQLKQNLQSLSQENLPVEILEACDQVWTTLKGPAPKYNR